MKTCKMCSQPLSDLVEEPTGFGAVVICSCGGMWVLHTLPVEIPGRDRLEAKWKPSSAAGTHGGARIVGWMNLYRNHTRQGHSLSVVYGGVMP